MYIYSGVQRNADVTLKSDYSLFLFFGLTNERYSQYFRVSVVIFDIVKVIAEGKLSDRIEENLEFKGADLSEDLSRAENDLVQQTLKLLRNRHAKEKVQWEKIYKTKEGDILDLRNKLQETENYLKKLKGEYIQDKAGEIEKLKLSVREINEKKDIEQQKWATVEQQVKFYRKMFDDVQARLAEEQGRLAQLRDQFIQNDKNLRKDIEIKDTEMFKLKETLSGREREWLKDRTRYSEEIKNLNERIKALENTFGNDKEHYLNVISKKDEDLAKYQKGLQDLAVELTKERFKNSELSGEIEIKDRQLISLQLDNKSAYEKVAEERRTLFEEWQREKNEWDKYKNGILENELNLKQGTEEQVARVMGMLETLETQLIKERDEKDKLNTELAEKNKTIDGLKEELIVNQATFDQHRNEYEKKGHEILLRYENSLKSKDNEIIGVNEELLQVKANLSKEEKLFHIEKNEKQRLAKLLEEMNDDKAKLLNQYEQEKAEWKKTLLQEQLRNEEKLQEVNGKFENLLKTRQKEIDDMNNEYGLLTGQFGELRIIYQGTKIENEEQKSRINELETEVQKIFLNWEKERKEWENLLVEEQDAWVTRKMDILTRDERLKVERDKEIRRVEGALDESCSKVIELEGMLQEKERQLDEAFLKLSEAENEKSSTALKLDIMQKEYTQDIENNRQLWERRKGELTERHNILSKDYEAEIIRINGLADRYKALQADEKKAKEQKNTEIHLLQDKIITLTENINQKNIMCENRNTDYERLSQDYKMLKLKLEKDIRDREQTELVIANLNEKIKELTEKKRRKPS